MGIEKGNIVDVHSILTVVAGTPVKPGSTCPLSPLDRAMGQHKLDVIFYYGSGFAKFERIRPALNEMLTLYPNVTGRLGKDNDGNWEVKCTDAGVRLFLAKAGTTLDEWLRSADHDDEMHLTVSEDLPDDPKYWSPFRIQITEFEGGGTAIALSCLHMLADPTSVTLFIKSWNDCHQGEAITHPLSLNSLALCNPSTTTTTMAPSDTYYVTKSAAPEPQSSVKMASATFSFSDSKIKQSLSEIHSVFPDASPFDLLTALFWVCIKRLKSRTHDLTQSISICTDMRRRLRAPLPYGYFGNALHFSQLTVDANKLDKEALCHVTELVHRHMSGIKEDDFWSAIGWLESRKDDKGKFVPPFRMYGPELTCVNMEDLIAPVGTYGKESQPLMYMASFEKDQKPLHVSYHVGNVEGEGLIMVMPSPEGGLARRVTVTLPKEEMEKLLEDKTILSLEPTLLLSGRG